MKKLFLILILTIGLIKVSACKCVTKTLVENYLSADVVGVIKIIKVYDENDVERTHKADVEFEKIYKGERFKTLNVRGLIGNPSSGACETSVKVGEEYLILLSKYNNSYGISSCSPKYRVNPKKEKENLKALEKTFAYIDKNKFRFIGLEFTSCYDELQKGDKSSLSGIKNFSPKNPFAIYKIKINDLSKIEKITPITTFGNKDKVIEKIMMNNMTVDIPGFAKNESDEYLILLLYLKDNIDKKYGEVISSEW
ncbi:hypothetical protein [Chryseobacterium sp. JUb7]|uniref:hypothetical protein n=1 Tax=Chryseobacterium sp. JUb7 TaxID=2940599 RepID=UPI002169A431|nr:hypothetical protein [Chryseobacterium sp. JUb7]MCS3531827.1 hypothetical protein [Chryseobacterium sp. JUb7]